MELWIRSQDKEILTAVQHLDIYEASIEGEEECYVIEESGTDLGSYKSYQRALEVLDEIQRHLVVINDKKDNLFYVYEMPEE